MDFQTRPSTLALLLVVAAPSVEAQSGRLSRPRAIFDLGVSAPALLVRDANGAELKLGIAPVAGVAATWSLSPRLRSMLGIHISSASLNGSDDGFTWDAGRATTASLSIGVIQTAGNRFSYSLSLGPTLLFGPDNVTPFADETSPMHWGGGAGASWRVSKSRPLAATVSFDTFMVGGATISDPIREPGWVRRFGLGVRYGG